MTSNADWLDALEAGCPDVVALFRLFAGGKRLRLRSELRRRTGPGTALDVACQLGLVAAALGEAVAALPEAAFDAPGGESDWNVAQALGHTIEARRGLTLAASLAAAGRFPADAARVTPSVPGPAGATREELLARLARSQSQVERAAAVVAGHEVDPCPLDHPLVGTLRCGEWLLFAGVHDLMHLEQLQRLLGPEAAG